MKQVPVGSTKYCYLKSLGGMTYKSKNLLPFPYYGNKGVGYTSTEYGITYTVNADRSVTLNGTSSGLYLRLGQKLKLPKGVYSISGCPAGGSSSTYYVVMSVYKENTWVAQSGLDIGNGAKWDISSFDFDEVRLTIVIPKDAIINNLTFKPMLSANEALPYEDYYEGLKDTKTTAIKVHGANFLDIEKALTAMKVPYTKDGDNYTATSLGFGEKNPYKFTDNPQIFTLSVDSSSNQNYTSPRIEMGYLDDNGTFTRYGVLVFGSSTTTVTSTSPVNAIRTTYSSSTGSPTSVTFSNMRINYGTVDCGYQEYKAPITYAIPEELQGTGRGLNSTYCDVMDFETDKCREIVGEAVYDGTETWVLNSTSGGFFLRNGTISNMMDDAPGLCSHFPHFKGRGKPTFPSVTCGNTYLSGIPIVWFQTYSDTDARGFASVAEWTDFLKEQYANGNPVTVYYVLKEPDEIDISTSSFNPLVEVEPGSLIEFITDNGLAPNSTIIYQTLV